MDRPGKLELTVGLFVLAGLFALLFLALRVSGLPQQLEQDSRGYALSAEFNDVGDLHTDAPVRIAGVTIGRVRSIALDPKTLEAVVTLHIDRRYNDLPKDTSASIYTEGLLGAEYVALQAGGDTQVLKNGDRITITQSAMVLENLIGHFLYNDTGGS